MRNPKVNIRRPVSIYDLGNLMKLAGKKAKLENSQLNAIVRDFRRLDYSHLDTFIEHFDSAFEALEESKRYARRANREVGGELDKLVRECLFYHMLDILRGIKAKDEAAAEKKMQEIIQYVREYYTTLRTDERNTFVHKRPMRSYLQSLLGHRFLHIRNIRNGRLISHLENKRCSLVSKLKSSIKYVAKVTHSGRSISDDEFHAIVSLMIQFLDLLYQELQAAVYEIKVDQILEVNLLKELDSLVEQARSQGHEDALEKLSGLRDRCQAFLKDDYSSIEQISITEPDSRAPADHQTGEIVVISDTHVSKVLQDIGQRFGKELDMVNPNQILMDTIRRINGMRGVSAVVLNGDSIDYVYQDYVKKSKHAVERSNWEILLGILKGLKVPYYIIPGNHDHRTRAYNINFWGLGHRNVPDEFRKKHKDEIGYHDFRGLKEVESIGVAKRIFHPLVHSPVLNCPYRERIAGLDCIFIDTGNDGFVDPSALFKFGKRLAYSLIGGKIGYCGRGPTGNTIRYLRDVLGGGDSAYVFMHAPVLNPHGSKPGRWYQLRDTLTEYSMARNGLNGDTFIRNAGTLLHTLRRSPRNIFLITSHIHYAKYLLIDKMTFKVYEVTLDRLNKERQNPRFIKHLSTWGLGVIYAGRTVGYLRIRPDALEEVVVKRYS